LWVKRHPVLAYLILAYAVTWTIFLVPLLSREGLGVLPIAMPPVQLFILLASVVGLAGSAFLVTAVADGRPGVRALADRYTRWRVGVPWYLFALFGLPLIALLGAVVVFGGAALGGFARHWTVVPTLVLPQTILIALLVNLWEETGWTGFVFARLQPRYGAVLASLMVAPAFGGIHLPLFFVDGGLTDGRFPLSRFPFLVLYLLAVYSMPVRLIAAWLFNNARGSLLPIGLFHGALGVAANPAYLSTFVPAGFDPTWMLFGSYAVFALLLVLVTRGRLSSPPGGLSPAAPRLDVRT
jgi:membrane protease YdiL (CAAX protease family)